MTAGTVDGLLQRVEAGEPVTAAELRLLAAGSDILSLGMLADAWRERLHRREATYVRVHVVDLGAAEVGPVPPGAGEVRIAGVPGALDAALGVVGRMRQSAPAIPLTGFTGRDIDELARRAGLSLAQVLTELRAAGLEAVSEVALDDEGPADAVLDALGRSGLRPVRYTVRRPMTDRIEAFLRLQALQDRYGLVRAVAPLASDADPTRPTTGYDDVKTVALARLAAPGVNSVQVDWRRYGPKLAQVALSFGADDLDGVTPLDEAPEGRRRAPLEEVRRNIVAAGFTPVERDGRFEVRP